MDKLQDRRQCTHDAIGDDHRCECDLEHLPTWVAARRKPGQRAASAQQLDFYYNTVDDAVDVWILAAISNGAGQVKRISGAAGGAVLLAVCCAGVPLVIGLAAAAGTAAALGGVAAFAGAVVLGFALFAARRSLLRRRVAACSVPGRGAEPASAGARSLGPGADAGSGDSPSATGSAV